MKICILFVLFCNGLNAATTLDQGDHLDVQTGHDVYRGIKCPDGSKPYFKSVANQGFGTEDEYTILCENGDRGHYTMKAGQNLNSGSLPKIIWISSNKVQSDIKDAPRKATLLEIPSEVIKPCHDSAGTIADINEDWAFSDHRALGDKRPRTHLKDACKVSDQKWQLICESGGVGVTQVKYELSLVAGHWRKSSEESGLNLKTDCSFGERSKQ